jgi:hypothetical protein
MYFFLAMISPLLGNVQGNRITLNVLKVTLITNKTAVRKRTQNRDQMSVTTFLRSNFKLLLHI